MSNQPEYQLCLGCNRPMRRRGVCLELAPGTMATGHSGKCKSCVQPNTDKTYKPRLRKKRPSEEARLNYTVAGLNSFMVTRWARGVEREAANPIAYKVLVS